MVMWPKKILESMIQMTRKYPSPLAQFRPDPDFTFTLISKLGPRVQCDKKSGHVIKMHFRVMKQTTEVLVQGSFIEAYNLFAAKPKI